MYYHVYGDLFLLSQSSDSVLSMNKHYLELLNYLSEVKINPDIVFDPNHQVFPSEKRIYGSDPNRLKSEAVYNKLFENIDGDHDNLTKLTI